MSLSLPTDSTRLAPRTNANGTRTPLALGNMPAPPVLDRRTGSGANAVASSVCWDVIRERQVRRR